MTIKFVRAEYEQPVRRYTPSTYERLYVRPWYRRFSYLPTIYRNWRAIQVPRWRALKNTLEVLTW